MEKTIRINKGILGRFYTRTLGKTAIKLSCDMFFNSPEFVRLNKSEKIDFISLLLLASPRKFDNQIPYDLDYLRNLSQYLPNDPDYNIEKLQKMELIEIVTREQAQKDQRKRRKKRRQTIPKGFKQFWSEYPRRIHWKKALEAWKKINPNKDTRQAIIYGIRRHKRSKDWERGVIPAPHNWLLDERWNDEPPRAVPQVDGQQVEEELAKPAPVTTEVRAAMLDISIEKAKEIEEAEAEGKTKEQIQKILDRDDSNQENPDDKETNKDLPW